MFRCTDRQLLGQTESNRQTYRHMGQTQHDIDRQIHRNKQTDIDSYWIRERQTHQHRQTDMYRCTDRQLLGQTESNKQTDRTDTRHTGTDIQTDRHSCSIQNTASLHLTQQQTDIRDSG